MYMWLPPLTQLLLTVFAFVVNGQHVDSGQSAFVQTLFLDSQHQPFFMPQQQPFSPQQEQFRQVRFIMLDESPRSQSQFHFQSQFDPQLQIQTRSQSQVEFARDQTPEQVVVQRDVTRSPSQLHKAPRARPLPNPPTRRQRRPRLPMTRDGKVPSSRRVTVRSRKQQIQFSRRPTSRSSSQRPANSVRMNLHRRTRPTNRNGLPRSRQILPPVPASELLRVSNTHVHATRRPQTLESTTIKTEASTDPSPRSFTKSVIVSSTAPVPTRPIPKNVHLNANDVFLQCCKDHRVDESCESRCNFEVLNKKVLTGMFLGSDPCPPGNGGGLMACAAQKKDHTECCIERGVSLTSAGDKCLGFCQMAPGSNFQADISMLPCWGVLRDIKSCFKDAIRRTLR